MHARRIAGAALLALSCARALAEEPADWLARAQAGIAAAEYHVTRQAGELQAPNRTHGFRTWFHDSGIELVPREGETEAWRWSLRWVAYGASLPSPARTVNGNRVAYRRGGLEEWYENRPEGLKQGFHLDLPPSGLERAAAVHLDLALGGTLFPVLLDEGKTIDFVDGSGARVLRYAGLQVKDGRDREVPSRMELNGDLLRLVLDVREAAWPLTVDPMITFPAWTSAVYQTGAQLGAAVAPAGDINGDGFGDILVGAPLYDGGQTDEGQVLVFHGSASGLPANPTTVIEVNQAGASFGSAVAGAGDVNGDGYADVLVGARLHDGALGFDSGGAFLYYGSAAGVSFLQVWAEYGSEQFAHFGSSVAGAGDVDGDGFADVIVGAPDQDVSGQIDAGAFHVFRGAAGGLNKTASWIRSGSPPQASAGFGTSVAGAGDVNSDGFADVIAGAPLHDGGQADEGGAFAFLGSAAGLAASPGWTAESNEINARFGTSVAGGGDVNCDGYADVIVGAPLHDGFLPDVGRAFAYHGSASGLGTGAAWNVQGFVSGGPQLGFSVASAGDVNGDGCADVIVGLPRTGIGTAEVFQGSAAGLNVEATWIQGGGQSSSEYGTSVASAGDVNGDGLSDVLVGAPRYDNTGIDSGRAVVHYGATRALHDQQLPAWTVALAAGDGFGQALSSGDVNGDGYDDVVVGAPFFDGGGPEQGRVFAFHGAAAGLETTPAWTAEGAQVFELFGFSVSAGDVNADGYADLVIGAASYDGDGIDEGRAYAFLGSASGLGVTPVWTAERDGASTYFGSAVAVAGDVDGDGFGEVVVGAPANGGFPPDQPGRAFVYRGTAGGPAPAPAWTLSTGQVNDALGAALGAGDFNGDGFADLVVGAPSYTGTLADEGAAFVYHGAAPGLTPTPAWTRLGGQVGASYGAAVSTAGDRNGDGWDDLIVGSPDFDVDPFFNRQTGRAYLYRGSASGVTGSFVTVDAGIAGSRIGASVALAGDVDGDGLPDVAVGAPGYEQPSTRGLLKLVYGSATFAPGPATFHYGFDLASAFGSVVASAGDVNGDGHADVLVTDPSAHGSFLYYGSGGRSRSRDLRQRQLDGGPIAPGGSAGSPDGFRLALTGHAPYGRGRVRAEWEVKPFGVPFDGVGTQVSGPYVDTGVGGVPFDLPVPDLQPDTRYHWRVRLQWPGTAAAPFGNKSRWLSLPTLGSSQAMVRTDAPASGAAPSLQVGKDAGTTLALSWGASCTPEDTSYAVYEGALGDFASHEPVLCDTAGATSATFEPAAGDRYYLVVPRGTGQEGSYGRNGAGAERPASAQACVPQSVATCP